MSQPTAPDYPAAHDARATGRPGVLILHGWQNHRPAGHWQHWLARRLAHHGRQVAYPQLPSPDNPALAEWVDAAVGALYGVANPRLVICHSLGCLTWLHLTDQHRHVQIDRLLFVAPPSPDVIGGIPEIAGFVPAEDLNSVKRRLARRVTLVCADNDEYCPEGAWEVYGHLPAVETVVLPGQGHFDMPAGYGSWPGVLDWALGKRTRVEARSQSALA